MDTAKEKLIESAKWAFDQLNAYYKNDLTGRPDALKLKEAIEQAERARTPEETHFFDLAKEVWDREGETEIDDDAVVSVSENGAYVQAWVWVDA